MNNKNLLTVLIGIVILVAIAVFGYRSFQSYKAPLNLKGVVGSEKEPLMAKDPEWQKAISKGRSVTLEVATAGSLKMIKDVPAKDIDFLFPGSQIISDRYKEKGYPSVRSEVIYQTPLVFYSWKKSTEALQAKGIITVRDGVYFLDLAKFVAMIESGTTWASLGIDAFGPVHLYSSDPRESNSGMVLAGLLATVMLGNNDVVNESNVAQVEAKLQRFFASSGHMSKGTGNFFKNFIQQGSPALIVGYENQLIEYARLDPVNWEKRKNDICIIYPVPTCWNDHQLIALNHNGAELIDVLLTPEAQQIAWKNHGFRSAALSAVDNDFTIVSGVTIPPALNQVVPMPNAPTMRRILLVLGHEF